MKRNHDMITLEIFKSLSSRKFFLLLENAGLSGFTADSELIGAN